MSQRPTSSGSDTGLPCGNYLVQFVNPDTNNYELTLPCIGADSALDSDADPSSGFSTCQSGCIVLGPGETNRTIDAAFGILQGRDIHQYRDLRPVRPFDEKFDAPDRDAAGSGDVRAVPGQAGQAGEAT